LWLAALDAESRRDFVAAAKLYEKMESLPGDIRPASLHTRLNWFAPSWWVFIDVKWVEEFARGAGKFCSRIYWC